MDKITLPLEVKNVKEDTTADVFTFEGLLAAFDNIDHDNDVIRKGAFSEWLTKSREEEKKSVPVFWSHKASEPIGVFPIGDIAEVDKGLFVKGVLPKDDTFVSGRVIPQMRIGSISKMSIGYRVKDYDYEGSVRVLKNIVLWEGSLVSLPANEDATITSFKSVTPFGNLPLADRQRGWDSDSAIGRIRERAGLTNRGDLTDPDVQKRYREAFFWYDGDDPDLIGSYKLPFADVIDGTLTAVPRGVFAAAAALNGARGGVYLPGSDRPMVVRNVERYYEKMGMESPFGKSFRMDDFSCLDERSIERTFRSGVRFSSKLAKGIVSAIKSAGLCDVDSMDQREVADDSRLIEEIDMVMKKIKGEL